MNEKGTQDTNSKAEPEDMLAIVEKIRSVPRVRPGAAFRFRMAIYSRFPIVGCRLIERREAYIRARRVLGPDAKRHFEWLPSAGRIAAAVAMILVVAFGTFGALALAAKDSRPGDALYSIKRFREDLELAFTWNSTKKAEKNLTIAEARLSELDYLVTRKRLDAENVERVVSDYNEKTRTVEELLSEEGVLQDAQGIATQLRIIRTTEKNIEKRLSAAGEQVTLARASGALVTIKDPSGRVALDSDTGNLRTKAGTGGKVSFIANAAKAEDAGGLEAFIELDGRSEILPLYAAREKSPNGPVTASVTPTPSALVIDQPQIFTLTLTSSEGSTLGGRALSLIDGTGTSSINGKSGEVSLSTDRNGVCSFSVKKTSLERVTRISARLEDGADQDLGEVLVVGGLKTPGTEATGVSVTTRSLGPAVGPQGVELDNGLVRVTVDAGRPGLVIGGVEGLATPGRAGPLYEPMAVGAGATSGLRVSDPRLTFSDAGAAGYEVAFELPYNQGTVRKTYDVSLSRGDSYATVNCRIEVTDRPTGTSGDSSVLEVCRLEIPAGCKVNVSGKTVSTPAGDDPLLASFQFGDPYMGVASNGGQALLACPIDSDTYPASWLLGKDYLGARLPESILNGDGRSATFLLGVTSEDGVARIKSKAVHGIGEVSPAQTADQPAGDGFLVTTDPTRDELSSGRQRINLSIFKMYEKIFGN